MFYLLYLNCAKRALHSPLESRLLNTMSLPVILPLISCKCIQFHSFKYEGLRRKKLSLTLISNFVWILSFIYSFRIHVEQHFTGKCDATETYRLMGK
jgi:hypothetical protein